MPYKDLSEEQKEIIRERNKKYYHDNKEIINKRVKEYNKYYYKNNLEELRQRQQEYYSNNKDICITAIYKWCKENPLYQKEYYKNRNLIKKAENKQKMNEVIISKEPQYIDFN